MLLFYRKNDKTQMPKPPECADIFFKTLWSNFVGHRGLLSMSYRVDTPFSSGPPCSLDLAGTRGIMIDLFFCQSSNFLPIFCNIFSLLLYYDKRYFTILLAQLN